MNKYKVQSRTSSAHWFFCTARGARTKAQEVAEFDDSVCEVWELIETANPKTNMVTKDIEEILAKLQSRTMFIPCVIRGIILELKKQGITSLELPSEVDM